jgi:hypothetical protein
LQFDDIKELFPSFSDSEIKALLEEENEKSSDHSEPSYELDNDSNISLSQIQRNMNKEARIEKQLTTLAL